MKKYFSTLLLLAVIGISATSCNQYRSVSTATKVSQLSGNPFYFNLAKNLKKNIVNFMAINAIQSSEKLNLLTPISSILKTGEQINGFKNMLSTAYQIYPKKLDQGFDKLGNMRDLISFIAQNGRNFNFSK